MKTTVKKRGKKYYFYQMKFYERCLAWDVSPFAPTPFGFLLLFFSFFFFFIINSYCILQEEYPIKLWKKNMRFWSLLSNGNKNYYESIQIEFLKLFAAKTRFVGENYIFTDFCTTQSHLSLRPVAQLVTRPVDKELLVASTCCNDMSPRPISLS